MAAAEKPLRAALQRRIKEARTVHLCKPLSPVQPALLGSFWLRSHRPLGRRSTRMAYLLTAPHSLQAGAATVEDLLPAHVVAAANAAASRMRSVRVNTLKATVEQAEEALREALPGEPEPPSEAAAAVAEARNAHTRTCALLALVLPPGPGFPGPAGGACVFRSLVKGRCLISSDRDV